MTTSARRFYDNVKQSSPSKGELVDLFIFHLTVDLGAPSASVKDLTACFEECDLATPAGLAVQLSKGLTSKPVRYLKKNGGYRLESRVKEAIADRLGQTSAPPLQASATLRQIETKIMDGQKRDFLKETITCFMAGANRAAVVMCWNLALHHLYDYVLKHELATFNVALGKNTDTRVKIKVVSKIDDFTEMPESKFLVFLREAKIITTSLFNKLESWLDDRNAAAHPSGYKVTPKVAEAYVDDLVENVILKFAV